MIMRLVAMCLWLSFITSLSAQSIELTATTDAQQVLSSNYFKVTFTLKNGQAQSFEPPNWGDIQLLSGPNRSSEVSIINGKMSQKMSYIYTVYCEKVGEITIGPATAVVNGQRYTSDPITVEVLKGKEQKDDKSVVTDDDIFVEAQLSQDTGCIGQQITLKYVLYTTQSIGSYRDQSMPNLDGFYVEHLPNYRERPTTVVRDGKQYTTQSIRVYALFPQQKGKFTIDPIAIELGISTNKGGGSFFFNRQLRPLLVKTNSVDLTITDLPTDSVPISYADAIGEFYLGTAIDKKRLPKDDALTMTYQIKGDGDGKIFKAPQQSYTDLFEIYEPNLLRADDDIIDDKVITTKTYEYLMIPKKEGAISFRPELSYYSPDSQRYMTLLGETYTVNVSPPTGRQRKDVAQQMVEWPAPYSLEKVRSKRFSLWGSVVHYALLASALLIALIMLIAYRRKVRIDAIDPSIKRNNKAKAMAIAQLKEAKRALSVNDSKEFYIQLRKGLLEYLSNKTYQDSSQMSKEDIISLLKENDLSSYEDDIIDVMKKGEMAIYANMSSGDEQDMYKKIIAIIEKIETKLKK